MKVVTEGVLPENKPMHGTCANCGCVVECTRAEAGLGKPKKGKVAADPEVKCPTKGCGNTIPLLPGKAPAPRSPLDDFLRPGEPDHDRPWKWPVAPKMPRPELLWRDARPRTKAEVARERRENPGGAGCCERYANMQACDCFATAVCDECRGTGWAVHPENGWNPDARRCSRGCPSKCSVCNNPGCDNPNGQH